MIILIAVVVLLASLAGMEWWMAGRRSSGALSSRIRSARGQKTGRGDTYFG